ncbi:T-cell surface glycoprotein CD4-like [Pyxicephalus adspersus]|uniref:T-cell surface glycoprotein CD4-like n=1 Tax=Pyxicephalus adspersus TaxID=30357 RepID=UPI003B5AF231
MHSATFGKKSRFKVPDRSTNNLEITGVQLTDSGNYTCLKDTQTWTEELVVLQVEAIPLGTLLATEDLTLTIQYPSQMPLTVSWWKDKKISDGPVLKKKNLQIEDSGMYTYRVKMGVGEEKVFEKQIEVKGFYHSQSIVYTTGKRPVTIPWFFNFNVRQTPLEKDAKVLEGNITFSSQMIKPLTIDNGAVCWQKSCDTKSGDSKNLSYYLKSPKNGTYRMEIVLQIDGRQKHLRRDVCVANLTDLHPKGSEKTSNCIGYFAEYCTDCPCRLLHF